MASFRNFRLVPVRDDIRDTADEWAGLGDAKERRKRQNRINKRAARRRQRLHEAQDQEAGPRPVHAPKPCVNSSAAQTGLNARTSLSTTAVYFPLTRDSQLLHVISINVSRAVLTNYFIISSIPLLSPRFCSFRRVFTLPSQQEMLCLSDGTADKITLPPALMPTQTQQQVPHPGWIDLFPSPQLRDNLILALVEHHVDEDAFMVDLVGNLFIDVCCTEGDEDELETELDAPVPRIGYPGVKMDQTGMEITANAVGTMMNAEKPDNDEPGLVSWSDPWDITGWEVTESFMKKWEFLLQGCREVINATNVWREIRGEEPLVLKS